MQAEYGAAGTSAFGSFHALDIPSNFFMIGSFPLSGSAADYIFRKDNRQGRISTSDAVMVYSATAGNKKREGIENTPSLFLLFYKRLLYDDLSF
jgi:hypothetical protein